MNWRLSHLFMFEEALRVTPVMFEEALRAVSVTISLQYTRPSLVYRAGLAMRDYEIAWRHQHMMNSSRYVH